MMMRRMFKNVNCTSTSQTQRHTITRQDSTEEFVPEFSAVTVA